MTKDKNMMIFRKKTITGADYTNDLALSTNTPAQAEYLQHIKNKRKEGSASTKIKLSFCLKQNKPSPY